MLRSAITHVSLLAVLLHLHWGSCAHHLPACEQQTAAAHCDHGHHHEGDVPADLPAHDDCHETHAATALSQAVVAPSPDADGTCFLPVAATVDGVAANACLTVAIGRANQRCPLPLRAHPRSQTLLN